MVFEQFSLKRLSRKLTVQCGKPFVDHLQKLFPHVVFALCKRLPLGTLRIFIRSGPISSPFSEMFQLCQGTDTSRSLALPAQRSVRKLRSHRIVWPKSGIHWIEGKIEREPQNPWVSGEDFPTEFRIRDSPAKLYKFWDKKSLRQILRKHLHLAVSHMDSPGIRLDSPKTCCLTSPFSRIHWINIPALMDGCLVVPFSVKQENTPSRKSVSNQVSTYYVYTYRYIICIIGMIYNIYISIKTHISISGLRNVTSHISGYIHIYPYYIPIISQ